MIESLKDIFLVYQNYREVIRPINQWSCFKKKLIDENYNIVNEVGWEPFEKTNFKIYRSINHLIENKNTYLALLYLLKDNYITIQDTLKESIQEPKSEVQLSLLRFTKQFYFQENVKNIIFELNTKNLIPLLVEAKEYKILEDIVGSVATTAPSTAVDVVPGSFSGDVAEISSYIGEEDENPDVEDTPETLNNKRVFTVTQKEFYEFKEGKKYWFWKTHTTNDDVRRYATKNPTKSFYVRFNHFYFLVPRGSTQ